MRKIFLTLILISLVSLSFGQLSISLDFVQENTTLSKISAGTYNFVTDKYYVCDYDATDPGQCVPILNQDGTESSTYLNTTGLTMGTLQVFAITCGSDGVIYGGTNIEADPKENNLFRWASESAVPTQQTIADFRFTRVMDVNGTGADTIIVATGEGDDSPVDILTTTDGSTFVLSETTPGLANVKQGIAVNLDGTVLYGTQGYSTPPAKYIKGVSTWEADPTFAPTDDPMDPDNWVLFNPCPIGYWDERDVLFGYSSRSTDDNGVLSAIDGTDGSLLDSIQTGVNDPFYGYGNIELDMAALGGEGRLICRDAGDTGYIAAKFTVAYPTPSPTPLVLQANSAWGLYE